MDEFIRDYTTDYLNYCKYNNWSSVKNLIERKRIEDITFNLQRGFAIACYHRSFAVIKVLIENYGLNTLLLNGFFLEYILKEKDETRISDIIKLGNLVLTPDMHGYIEIPFSNNKLHIINAFLKYANITTVINNLQTDEAKDYCIKYLRTIKLQNIITNIND